MFNFLCSKCYDAGRTFSLLVSPKIKLFLLINFSSSLIESSDRFVNNRIRQVFQFKKNGFEKKKKFFFHFFVVHFSRLSAACSR